MNAMTYRTAPRLDVGVSLFSLGGHEYLPNGRSRGFNEDFDKATKQVGYVFDGFGGEQRRATLQIAYDHGVNLFDVTQDSEKEALGRNLRELPPPYEIYVQTRPEGMCYAYDEFNRALADYSKLKPEIVRCLRLLKRDRIDLLNIGILRWAIDHDPEYLDKLALNIARLKQEGLIRWACADTFSGQWCFLRMIACGAFDAVNLNFNFADDGALGEVVPAAHKAGMAVFMREAFMKGALFTMAGEAGIEDRQAVAIAAIRWCLAQAHVTSLAIGTGNPDHLRANLAAINALALTEADRSLIERIKKKSASFSKYHRVKREEHLNG